MPISTDNTRLSIEFIYEYATPGGDVLQYQMKFQHTQHGPIVSIQYGPYEPTELPADMFTEVASFLAQQGAIKVATVPTKTIGSTNKPLSMPSIGRKLGGLPLSSITKAQQAPVAKSEPVQNIMQEADEEVTVSQIEIPDDPEDDVESKLLAERLKAERLAARAQANAAKANASRIRPDHKAE